MQIQKICVILYHRRRCDGIGRRTGFKIQRWQHRAGSTPATGTKKTTEGFPSVVFFITFSRGSKGSGSELTVRGTVKSRGRPSRAVNPKNLSIFEDPLRRSRETDPRHRHHKSGGRAALGCPTAYFRFGAVPDATAFFEFIRLFPSLRDEVGHDAHERSFHGNGVQFDPDAECSVGRFAKRRFYFVGRIPGGRH